MKRYHSYKQRTTVADIRPIHLRHSPFGPPALAALLSLTAVSSAMYNTSCAVGTDHVWSEARDEMVTLTAQSCYAAVLFPEVHQSTLSVKRQFITIIFQENLNILKSF
jgi:hypothetical protein